MKRLFPLLALPLLFNMISCSNDDVAEPSDEEQLAADIIEIDDYLIENGIDAQVHESGIRYVVDQEGDGDMPAVGDDIAVKFTSTIMGGDTIGLDTIGFTINLSQQIIEAWRIMIPEMKENGNITIYVPSVYAFGRAEIVGIPANSILVYNVELLARIDNADEQFDIDLQIIDEYLLENNIQVEEHDTGIRFVTLVEGDGNSPTTTDEIQVRYSGKFLDGRVFDDGDGNTLTFRLSTLIDSWKEMIPEMKEGGKIIFYSPSRYCYGTTGAGTIPPNAPLIFEIELVGIAN